MATSGNAINEGVILPKLNDREQGQKSKLVYEERYLSNRSTNGGKNGGKGQKGGKGMAHSVVRQPNQRYCQPGPSHIVQAADIVMHAEE